ncbi:endonuclease/exonuclease/phosphatase family protein [Bdellovibrio bacteriovorus]|uniref:endonuclease/exonuclease/phosphatase family protein n=1 Tax=Bdellovibrio bacteriovorus TaxID=959 RepID=UPI0035A668C4
MLKGWAVSALLFFTTVTVHAKYTIPDDRDVLTQFGTCHQEYLPAHFQVLVWNIKKGEAKADWARDFEIFTPRSDLVLLQESMIDNFVPAIALRQKDFCWDFATSFLDGKDATGVMNGGLTTPLSVQFLRSPGREPIANTPKMVILNEYVIANSQETLLIANIHGLNFVQNKLNREQILQVAAVLKKHTGPVIFAGDFNSWNQDRLAYLDEILNPLGLQKLKFKNDHRRLKLDHIYVRGLTTVDTNIHHDINSSDHKPLTAEFRLQ